MIGALQTSYAQTNESDRELKISDEEKIILFTGFSIVVIGIFDFSATDGERIRFSMSLNGPRFDGIPRVTSPAQPASFYSGYRVVDR